MLYGVSLIFTKNKTQVAPVKYTLAFTVILVEDSCAEQKSACKHLSKKFQTREFPRQETYTSISKRFAPLTTRKYGGITNDG